MERIAHTLFCVIGKLFGRFFDSFHTVNELKLSCVLFDVFLYFSICAFNVWCCCFFFIVIYRTEHDSRNRQTLKFFILNSQPMCMCIFGELGKCCFSFSFLFSSLRYFSLLLFLYGFFLSCCFCNYCNQ